MQEKLEALLKKKGIGPEGSKSLKQEELDELYGLFQDPSVSLTTKATMLTALLTLKPTEVEKKWIELVLNTPEKCLPVELLFLTGEETRNFLELIIKKVVSHQDLNREECLQAMEMLLDPETPPHLKGAFLEAERLKRETFTENKAFFDFLYQRTSRLEVNVPLLIDICDSYDGCTRTRNFSVFTAVLLASAGFPTCLHGVEKVAPKEGITTHQILVAAGKDPYQSMEAAAQHLADPGIRWAYADQKIFFPELHALRTVRKEMVKRPYLATFEKLLQPLQVPGGNILVSGYTHPHYREEVVKQIQSQGLCRQAIILKGAEGSTQLSMTRNTVCIHYDGKNISDTTVHPSQFGLEAIEAKPDRTLTVQDSLNEGLAALRGEKNYARENILYLAMIILTKSGLMTQEDAMERLRECLDSGKTLRYWEG